LNTGSEIESIGVDNAVIQIYRLTINSIKDIGVSFEGEQTLNRYKALGKGYLDAIIESLGRRDTCTLQSHFDEFDLGDATGSVAIASGVYTDVLQVFCKRVLETEDGVEPTNYSWNAYYANGVGLVFAEGNWVILDEDNKWFVVGEAYLIPDY